MFFCYLLIAHLAMAKLSNKKASIMLQDAECIV